jgi:hypothetical protein
MRSGEYRHNDLRKRAGYSYPALAAEFTGVDRGRCPPRLPVATAGRGAR